MTAKMGLSWVCHSIHAHGFKISGMSSIHIFFLSKLNHNGYNPPTFQRLHGLPNQSDHNLLWLLALGWLLLNEETFIITTAIDDLHRKYWPNYQTNKTATPQAKTMFSGCERMCSSIVPTVFKGTLCRNCSHLALRFTSQATQSYSLCCIHVQSGRWQTDNRRCT